jgi:predicted ribosome quality control (RQC) complex YloA/Tae2 family protein
MIFQHISNFSKILLYYGRSQVGNDKIIDECQKYDSTSLWFHLAQETSAHAILVFSGDDILFQDKIDAAKWIQAELSKKKKDDVMICSLQDVQKTSTPGMVLTQNETYMSSSTWTNKLKN